MMKIAILLVGVSLSGAAISQDQKLEKNCSDEGLSLTMQHVVGALSATVGIGLMISMIGATCCFYKYPCCCKKRSEPSLSSSVTATPRSMNTLMPSQEERPAPVEHNDDDTYTSTSSIIMINEGPLDNQTPKDYVSLLRAYILLNNEYKELNARHKALITKYVDKHEETTELNQELAIVRKKEDEHDNQDEA